MTQNQTSHQVHSLCHCFGPYGTTASFGRRGGRRSKRRVDRVTGMSSTPPWLPALLEHLSDEPTTTDDLVEALEDEFPDIEADDVDAALQHTPTAYEIDEELWVDLAALADGLVLTHMIGADEIASSHLHADVDLNIFAELARFGLPLAGGGTVQTAYAGGLVLTGPEGWLDACADGTLISLCLRDGVLEVATCPDELTEESAVGELVELLQTEASQALEAHIRIRSKIKTSDPWLPFLPTLVELLTDHPDQLRRPTPPIALILLLAGVDYWDGMIAMAGTPRSAEEDQTLSDHQIRACVQTSVFLIGARMSPDEFEEDAPMFFTLLSDPAVTEYVAARVSREPLDEALLDMLTRVARRPAERARVALLRARSAEADGDSPAAERHIADALRHDPQLRAALEDAGIYAADRGDLSTADGYLRRADLPPDHALKNVIRRLGPVPATNVGRNQPCPCGSGRKYKVCHLRDEVHPLSARGPLVYARLLAWVDRWGVDELPTGSADPMLLRDLAIFEGGMAEEYLRQRGPLLRDDERTLLQGWLSSKPQPYEVSDAKPGAWITLQSLLGGEPVTLPDRLLSQSAKPGDILVARVVDGGDGPAVLTNPQSVPAGRRHELIDLFGEFDPDELVRFFDRAPTLPVLQNRDGHDFVLCEVTVEVPASGATAAWRRLRESLTDQEGPNRLLWGRDLGEETLHLGTVTRNGRLWTLETNSRERMEELELFVFEAAPNARLVSSTATPGYEALASEEAEPGEPPTPEMLEVVRQYIEQHERKWVDQAIQALDGLTPREALAKGGVARRKLDELLDGMDQTESEHSMSAQRVRALLGLAKP